MRPRAVRVLLLLFNAVVGPSALLSGSLSVAVAAMADGGRRARTAIRSVAGRSKRDFYSILRVYVCV